MRILVTNDDGIHAPGLVAAEKIARALTDDVWIVAPETEQSGASHSLTLTMPLRLREIDNRRFRRHRHADRLRDDGVRACDEGRAADADPLRRQSRLQPRRRRDLFRHYRRRDGGLCARHPIDRDVAVLWLRTAGSDIRWSCGEAHGPPLIKKLVEIGWPTDVLMNINFPDCEPGDVKGTEITMQGKRDMQTAALDRRVDARGNPYFWIGFKRVRSNPPEGTDLRAIYEKRISVTPLHLNLTERDVMESLREAFAK